MENTDTNSLKERACVAFLSPEIITGSSTRDWRDKYTHRIIIDDGSVTSSGVFPEYSLNIQKQSNGDLNLSFNEFKDLNIVITSEEQKQYMSYMCQLIENNKYAISDIIDRTLADNKIEEWHKDSLIKADVFNLLTGGKECFSLAESENLLADAIDVANSATQSASILDGIIKDTYAEKLQTPKMLSENNAQRDLLVKQALKNLYLGIALNKFYKEITNSSSSTYSDINLEAISKVPPKNPLAEMEEISTQCSERSNVATSAKEAFDQQKALMFEEKGKLLTTSYVSAENDTVNLEYKKANNEEYGVSFKWKFKSIGRIADSDEYYLETHVTKLDGFMPKELYSSDTNVGYFSMTKRRFVGKDSFKECLKDKNLFDNIEDETLKVILRRAQTDALSAVEDYSRNHTNNMNKLADVRNKLAKKFDKITETIGLQKATQAIGIDIKTEKIQLPHSLVKSERKLSAVMDKIIANKKVNE